ncbi:hypothetical protein ABZ682_19500 [Streptomyces griseoviridis]|uniref:hypothetical protein n=1 Tax=Streptomyces griseoviridis TaxID=45398 RepID=UPI0033D41C80
MYHAIPRPDVTALDKTIAGHRLVLTVGAWRNEPDAPLNEGWLRARLDGETVARCFTTVVRRGATVLPGLPQVIGLVPEVGARGRLPHRPVTAAAVGDLHAVRAQVAELTAGDQVRCVRSQRRSGRALARVTMPAERAGHRYP